MKKCRVFLEDMSSQRLAHFCRPTEKKETKRSLQQMIKNKTVTQLLLFLSQASRLVLLSVTRRHCDFIDFYYFFLLILDYFICLFCTIRIPPTPDPTDIRELIIFRCVALFLLCFEITFTYHADSNLAQQPNCWRERLDI